jgi:hypothetical protein
LGVLLLRVQKRRYAGKKRRRLAGVLLLDAGQAY